MNDTDTLAQSSVDKAQHTPGGWTVGSETKLDSWGNRYADLAIYGIAEQVKIACIETWIGDDNAESEANANLIAAAPDLYTAALLGLQCIERELSKPEIMQRRAFIMSALSKAKGE